MSRKAGELQHHSGKTVRRNAPQGEHGFTLRASVRSVPGNRRR